MSGARTRIGNFIPYVIFFDYKKPYNMYNKPTKYKKAPVNNHSYFYRDKPDLNNAIAIE
jgi:hypothetical protein